MKTSSNIILTVNNLKPYDGITSADSFLLALSTHPELEENLYSMFESNTEWVKKASVNSFFYFILNQSIRKPFWFKPSVQLSYVGPDRTPTISIDI